MKQIIFIILVSISFNSFSQNTLKGGKLKKELIYIKEAIDNNNFEEAMTHFYSEDNLIILVNVNKKQQTLYSNISEVLNQKKKIFENNEIKMKQYQKDFDNKRFCDALEIFQLNLSNTNSYTETQISQNILIEALSTTPSKCNDNQQLMNSIDENINNNNLELVYNIFLIADIDLQYFYSEDTIKLRNYKEILHNDYTNYINTFEDVISDPLNSIKFIDYSNMSYWEAVNKIDYLTSVINTAPQKINNLKGRNPKINQSFQQVDSIIDMTLVSLEYIRQKAQPLSPKQIERLFSQKRNLSEIRQYANEIVGSYDDFDRVNCTINGVKKTFEYDRFCDLMALDVVSFNKLGRQYNSELKRAMFKKTSSYKELYDEMKKDYDCLKDAYYFITDGISGSYNMNSKCFKIWGQVHDINNPQLGYNTQYIQYYSLALRKPYNIKKSEKYSYIRGSDDYFLNTYWYVPITNEDNAFKIENAGKSAKVLVLFKIFETVDNPNKNFIYATNKVMKANVKKILLINENNDFIAVQYTY